MANKNAPQGQRAVQLQIKYFIGPRIEIKKLTICDAYRVSDLSALKLSTKNIKSPFDEKA